MCFFLDVHRVIKENVFIHKFWEIKLGSCKKKYRNHSTHCQKNYANILTKTNSLYMKENSTKCIPVSF